jgi:hypothetical protein
MQTKKIYITAVRYFPCDTELFNSIEQHIPLMFSPRELRCDVAQIYNPDKNILSFFENLCGEFSEDKIEHLILLLKKLNTDPEQNLEGYIDAFESLLLALDTATLKGDQWIMEYSIEELAD